MARVDGWMGGYMKSEEVGCRWKARCEGGGVGVEGPKTGKRGMATKRVQRRAFSCLCCYLRGAVNPLKYGCMALTQGLGCMALTLKRLHGSDTESPTGYQFLWL